MNHILCVWELGEDLGHLARIAIVAEEFVRRGHRVTVVAKDLSRAQLFFPDSEVQLMQAPIWLPRLRKPRLTKTQADVLAYKGYGDVEGLTALVRAWRAIYDFARPDLLMCDYAPTALLASRGCGIPRVVFGNSFTAPQPGTQGQDICPWVPAPKDVMRRNEARIVDNINAVARSLGLPGVRYVSDLYESEATFLTDLPLLDIHRETRQFAVFVGPPPPVHYFPPCDWGAAEGKRVFVYLKPDRPHVHAALKALAESPLVVRGYFPGKLPPDLIALQGPKFKLSGSPCNVAASLESADALAIHGGVGTVCEALLAGLPVFSLPTQVEQIYNSRRLSELNMGAWAGEKDTQARALEQLQRFLVTLESGGHDSSCSRQFAEYRALDFRESVVGGCEQLLKGR